MDTTKKVVIGVGVGVAILAAVGLYEHFKKPAAAQVLTGSPSVVLAPGTMANAILSLGAGGTYTFSLPAGASFATTQSAFTSNNPSVIPTPTSSTSPVTLKPMALGQTTLTINWVDASGNAQSSNVLITVNS